MVQSFCLRTSIRKRPIWVYPIRGIRLGESRLVLSRQVFPTKKTGIKRPCPRTYHCGGNPESCQNDRNPEVSRGGRCNPQFDCGDHDPHDWGPEAEKE